MYAPDTVTVFNAAAGEVWATVLRGVFLEASAGAEAQRSGMGSESAARLFIPFAARAEDPASGAEREYLPPREYERCEDRGGYWTLTPEGEGSAADCWFIKGVWPEAESYGRMRGTADGVFRVTAVTARDYGSPELRHWEVRGA